MIFKHLWLKRSRQSANHSQRESRMADRTRREQVEKDVAKWKEDQGRGSGSGAGAEPLSFPRGAGRDVPPSPGRVLAAAHPAPGTGSRAATCDSNEKPATDVKKTVTSLSTSGVKNENQLESDLDVQKKRQNAEKKEPLFEGAKTWKEANW